MRLLNALHGNVPHDTGVSPPTTGGSSRRDPAPTPTQASVSPQKLEPAQLRKIQSMDSGLGVPISRNGAGPPQAKISNGTSASQGPSKPAGGPTLIDEPFKKLKKPPPQSLAFQRSSTPGPSHGKADGDRRPAGDGRGIAASTSTKSLSDSSSGDTTDSKVLPLLLLPVRSPQSVRFAI